MWYLKYSVRSASFHFSCEISPPLLCLSEVTPESPEREGLAAAPVSIVVETLEDMSLSSNSSLDRNDTSEEYMDDFDNLGAKEKHVLHSYELQLWKQ